MGKFVKAIDTATLHNLSDAAMVMTLYDTGVRAAELCSMNVDDLDWRARSILVTGNASM